MPREHPPHPGVLKVEIPCGRAFRGNAAHALIRILADTHAGPSRDCLERLNKAIAEAPWSAQAAHRPSQHEPLQAAEDRG